MLRLAATVPDRPPVLVDRRRIRRRRIRPAGRDHLGMRNVARELSLPKDLEVVRMLVLVSRTQLRRKRS